MYSCVLPQMGIWVEFRVWLFTVQLQWVLLRTLLSFGSSPGGDLLSRMLHVCLILAELPDRPLQGVDPSTLSLMMCVPLLLPSLTPPNVSRALVVAILVSTHSRTWSFNL